MIERTQTSLAPGNCWQTCVACIINIDPEELPSQVRYDVRERTYSGWGSYLNVLNGYLAKHHGLMYAEIYEYQIGAVMVRDPGWHMLIGPTVRTEAHRAANAHHINHMVVARYGELIWDPHPSRAGLTEVERWGVLGAFAGAHPPAEPRACRQVRCGWTRRRLRLPPRPHRLPVSGVLR